MVGLIIATHGNTCEELVKSAEMFSGPLKNCETWSLNPGDSIELGEKKLEQYVERLDEGAGVIIMTDLFGGTPSNTSAMVAAKKSYTVIAGLNLPMLIEAEMKRGTMKASDLAEDLTKIAREGVRNIRKIMKERQGKR